MEKQDLTKFISKKTSVVIATGIAILRTDVYETQLILGRVAVIYMIIDAIKQIVQIVWGKSRTGEKNVDKNSNQSIPNG